MDCDQNRSKTKNKIKDMKYHTSTGNYGLLLNKIKNKFRMNFMSICAFLRKIII